MLVATPVPVFPKKDQTVSLRLVTKMEALTPQVTEARVEVVGALGVVLATVLVTSAVVVAAVLEYLLLAVPSA